MDNATKNVSKESVIASDLLDAKWLSVYYKLVKLLKIIINAIDRFKNEQYFPLFF